MILPLNEKQLKELPQNIDRKRRPVRFLCNGQAVNICTGILSSKHSNVIYHPIYWDRPKTFIKEVLKFLKENNPKAKFTITYH